MPDIKLQPDIMIACKALFYVQLAVVASAVCFLGHKGPTGGKDTTLTRNATSRFQTKSVVFNVNL